MYKRQLQKLSIAGQSYIHLGYRIIIIQRCHTDFIDVYKRQLICIDFKKNRIRIHRNTLRQIGNQEYIQLLVNPDQKMIGIKAVSYTHLDVYKRQSQATYI